MASAPGRVDAVQPRHPTVHQDHVLASLAAWALPAKPSDGRHRLDGRRRRRVSRWQGHGARPGAAMAALVCLHLAACAVLIPILPSTADGRRTAG